MPVMWWPTWITTATAIPRPASRASSSRSALRAGLAEGERDKEYDRFTKLYHYRAREYDPNTGRFLQEDPIWFNAGDRNALKQSSNYAPRGFVGYLPKRTSLSLRIHQEAESGLGNQQA